MTKYAFKLTLKEIDFNALSVRNVHYVDDTFYTDLLLLQYSINKRRCVIKRPVDHSLSFFAFP